jgi:hypothetical protein
LFTIKGNLVIMHNLYRKVAVASVCTALSFVLGASEEVKAATITVPPTIQFGVRIWRNRYTPPTFPSELDSQFNTVGSFPSDSGSRRKLAEFNISNFFMAPNTIIKSALFQDKFSGVQYNPGHGSFNLGIFGYIGNGTAEVSDADNGVLLSSLDLSSLSPSPGDIFNFDVTTFVNQQVSNGNPFAGFILRIFANDPYAPYESNPFNFVKLQGTDALGRSALVIETVDATEPVPEPTTIFGSALALSLGGWLKRKKLSPQNKTPSQD